MTIPAHCSHCGYDFASTMFNVAANEFGGPTIILDGCQESCPRCGKLADIQNGTWHVVGRVLTAIQAPGITIDQISAFRDITTALNSGLITPSDANQRIESFDAPILALWKWLNENAGLLGLVVSVISLWLAFLSSADSNELIEQQHNDALELRQAAELQTEAIRNSTTIQTRIYEELRKQTVVGQPGGSQQPPSITTRPSPQPQKKTSARPRNRHERRKAQALSRRQ